MSQQTVLADILQAVEQDCQISVCISKFPRKAALPEFARINITNSVASQFLSVVRKTCNALKVQVDSQNLVLQPFDIGAKHIDNHELEYFDFTSTLFIAAQVSAVQPVVNLPLFTGDPKFIAAMYCYVIVVEPPNESPILFFRRYSPSKELARSKKFAIIRAGGQYDKIENTALLFDEKIDCFSRGSLMFIQNKRDFQYIFRFFEMLHQAANASLDKIRQAVPIVNFDDFAASCATDTNKLTKLNSIADKPYLANITILDIKQVIQEFGLTGVQIVDDNGQEKLLFDASDRWAILKLLDDDFLASVLTKSRYEVNSKRNWEPVPP